MKNITKEFGENFKANDSVSFKAKKGEIHAIVGENGAGKTTLMKILYGMYKAERGEILIDDKAVTIGSPADAIKLGIGMVHQHFMLVGPLTVLENIILGDETTKSLGIIDYKACESKVNEITKTFNININLKDKVESLAVGTQQKIEILKILYRDARILILDEPTATLTPQETEELFKTLRQLKANGKTIILITHKLSEVLSISDTVTVLRAGKVAGELETKSTSGGELARLIIGEEISYIKPAKDTVKENVILAAENLIVLNDKKTEAVKNVSFEIHAGEILGIAGVEGNGQTELIEAINGLREIKSGKITINGKILNPDYIIAHIPANRHKHGIVMEYSISENVILGRENENEFSTPFILKEKNIIGFTEKLIQNYDIRTGSAAQKIGGLSGGNQQKVVAARELTKQTELIVASNPARGLDIKAANFVQQTLLDECRKSKAILLVSSDLTELLSLSNRIEVMYNGEIAAVLDAKNTNENEIGSYMTGLYK